MRFMFMAWAIVRKDILAELRTRDLLVSMLLFALLILVIMNFALRTSVTAAEEAAPGILWVTFTFAAVLGLNRSFIAEHENGCLQGLLLAPVDRGAIYLGKMLSNLVFIGIAEAIVLPLFAVLFNFPVLRHLGALVAVLFLGTLGFTAAGTLLAAMAASSRLREMLLPIILFPIVVPVIVATVKATAKVLGGHPLAAATPWLELLGAYDTIFLVIALLVFGYVVEE